MRKISKKREKQLEARLKLATLILAAAGWFMTNSLVGVIIMVALGFFTSIGVLIWQSIRHKERPKRSGINDIDSLDGVQFEYYLKELFISRGYKVRMTETTGDFGADLILDKDSVRIVVQAKRYSKAVGIKAVQEVISAVKMYEAEEAWVVTNNEFTKAAIELAGKNDVQLIGREILIDMINELNPHQTPDPTHIKRTVKQQTNKKCKKCGAEMIIRKGPNGIFYGCSLFPKCRYTSEAK